MPPRFFISTLLPVLLALSFGQVLATPRVVASIAPVHSLVSAVMVGTGAPQLLLQGGESPHTFSLRPSEARALNEADVLFWIGPQLEMPLARIMPNLAMARSVSLIDTPGLQLLPVPGLDVSLMVAESSAHDDTHVGEEAAVDPHIWLSPANAAVMTDEIARVLAELDPLGAPRYQSNAKQLKEQLVSLDLDLSRQLAGIDGSYVVFHDAYRYLEQRYGLQSAGTVTTHPERSPGAAHLRSLRREMAERQVRCLFSEPQFQPRLVAMLSEGLPVRHAILDPLGTDIPPGPEAYPQLMQALVRAFSGCMQQDTP